MSKTLPIYIHGCDILKTVCKEVNVNYPNLKNLIGDMIATVNGTKTGVGISAPQIGYPIRLFVTCETTVVNGQSVRGDFKAYINPVIVDLKGSKKKDKEGCLSTPTVYAMVERYQKVKIRYYDADFNEHTELYKGFDARVIQHEFDHLNGMMFFDHVLPNLPQKERDELKGKLGRMADGTISYEVEYETITNK